MACCIMVRQSVVWEEDNITPEKGQIGAFKSVIFVLTAERKPEASADHCAWIGKSYTCDKICSSSFEHLLVHLHRFWSWETVALLQLPTMQDFNRLSASMLCHIFIFISGRKMHLSPWLFFIFIKCCLFAKFGACCYLQVALKPLHTLIQTLWLSFLFILQCGSFVLWWVVEYSQLPIPSPCKANHWFSAL